MSDELVALATRLIGYDSSAPDGVMEAAGFVEGWLEARGIEVSTEEAQGLPVLRCEVGPADAVEKQCVARERGGVVEPVGGALICMTRGTHGNQGG